MDGWNVPFPEAAVCPFPAQGAAVASGITVGPPRCMVLVPPEDQGALVSAVVDVEDGLRREVDGAAPTAGICADRDALADGWLAIWTDDDSEEPGRDGAFESCSQLNSDPKGKCWTTGNLPSTSALYILIMPLLIFAHPALTPDMSNRIGLCSQKGPFLTS